MNGFFTRLNFLLLCFCWLLCQQGFKSITTLNIVKAKYVFNFWAVGLNFTHFIQHFTVRNKTEFHFCVIYDIGIIVRRNSWIDGNIYTANLCHGIVSKYPLCSVGRGNHSNFIAGCNAHRKKLCAQVVAEFSDFWCG